jgi:hypothetical protein
MKPKSNKPDAVNPSITLLLQIWSQGLGVADLERSATMRAERAKLKSCKDDGYWAICAEAITGEDARAVLLDFP